PPSFPPAPSSATSSTPRSTAPGAATPPSGRWARPASGPSTRSSRPTTSTWTCSTAPACWRRWPACSAPTTCPSARWSRRASAPRPGWCSSPTWPARPRCRRRCATFTSSTRSTASRPCCGSSAGRAAVRYVSTRGRAPVLDFTDVLLTGLAADGGLYVPEAWPALPEGWDEPRPYAELATEVLWPYVEGSALDRPDLARLVEEAYATFDHPDVCPLVEIEPGLCVVELFHGPTLAFKDVALQLVGRLFDHELARRGERATIVVATSGDTGSAAIAACVGRPNLDVVVLHPAGRVSDVQRRQMTTVDAPNVHNVAVEGTFDDCQALLKALFADEDLRRRVGLSAMNSINWARVAAQVVYYVLAAAAAGPCEVAVPTGNFGNILAGWIARRSGAPIERLIIGSNRNDILTRWVRTGDLVSEDVVPTLSPAMDIQVSSNHERL